MASPIPIPTHLPVIDSMAMTIDDASPVNPIQERLKDDLVQVDPTWLETNTTWPAVAAQIDRLNRCLQSINKAIQLKALLLPPATLPGMSLCHVWTDKSSSLDLLPLFQSIDAAVLMCKQKEILNGLHQLDNAARLVVLNCFSKSVQMINRLFGVLASGFLRFKLVPSDLVLHCLHFFKYLLDSMIYPMIDQANHDQRNTGDVAAWIQLAQQEKSAQRLFGGLLPMMTRVVRRSMFLFDQDESQEPVMTCLAYICLDPFFHEILLQPSEPSFQSLCPLIVPVLTTDEDTPIHQQATDARKPAHSVLVCPPDQQIHSLELFKLVCMDTLCGVFSSFPSQRQWILDDLLSNLDALTMLDYQELKRYRLRNNHRIHMVSALLMQLVQSCSLMDTSTRSMERTWLKRWEQKAAQHDKNEPQDTLDSHLLDRSHAGWKSHLDTAMKQSTYCIEFLLAKSKSKKKDAYSLTEYRAILEGTIEDVLAVLYDPDWPVAELILHGFTRTLVAFIDSDQGDIYLRTMAIEWLGAITCRLKDSLRHVSDAPGALTPEWLYQLYRLMPQKTNRHDTVSLKTLDACRMKLYQHLMKDASTPNVINFYLCTWGYANASLVKSIRSERDEETKVNHTCTEGDDAAPASTTTLPLLHTQCLRQWRLALNLDASQDVKPSFVLPELNRQDLQMLVELIASRQILSQRVPYFMTKLVSCLDKETVTFRVKALRGLGRMISIEPTLLNDTQLCHRILRKLYDASPSVRDASVDVLAKHLAHQQDIPVKMYELVSAKVNDTAPNVRKRIVKLLPSMYVKTESMEIKIDIAAKLLQRIDDNELAIQKLALKMAQQVLFQPFHDLLKGDVVPSFRYAPRATKLQITSITNIFRSIVAHIDTHSNGQLGLMASFVEKTVHQADPKQLASYRKAFQWIVDALFEELLALDEAGDVPQVIHCMTVIHAFTKPCPDLLHDTQISTLLPYLGVASSDDWTIAQYVMVLYHDILPRSKKSDVEFSKMVESALLQVLAKCPPQVIDDAASCFCALVSSVSHRYQLVIKTLGSCLATLKQDQLKLQQGQPLEKPMKTIKAMLISAMLCEHFDFEAKPVQIAYGSDLAKWTKNGTVAGYVQQVLCFFFQHPCASQAIKRRAVEALGHVFVSHPTFILSSDNITLLDQLFSTDDTAMKVELMHVLNRFLKAEEARLEKKAQDDGEKLYEKVIDVQTLLGNTEEFAELGVNGTLMQRYLPNLLEHCLSPDNDLRVIVFDVISAVINQGLAHPALCMPAIVAAETSDDPLLCSKAYYLHQYIHNKFGSILYTQLSKAFEAAYTYQKLVQGNDPRGYGNRGGDLTKEALLTTLFKLVNEKKKWRMDFLSNLVKPFAVEDNEHVDLAYLAFLADNLVTMPYAMVDEILCVLHAIDRLAMTNSVMDWLSLESSSDMPADHDDSCAHDAEEQEMALRVASMSTPAARALAILIRIRTTLVQLYSITDRDIQLYDPLRASKAKPAALVDIPDIHWTDLTASPE
ncbi:ARM repeat-containing protein [Hesseltinella vesiculosa]|uniref:Sister chromatid cohesion protein n=1 Tax=Hesseltinella vesiculosa TaxID=101127 RepID=A0A1X2G7T6_9FUNG|nr:ARM repeat-containing protein [Hesseltinella vesiculosa]